MVALNTSSGQQACGKKSMNSEIVYNLSPNEYKIMLFLASKGMANRVSILQYVWGYTDIKYDYLLKSAISRLRKRLLGTEYSIVNVPAIMGYKLVVNHNQVMNTFGCFW